MYVPSLSAAEPYTSTGKGPACIHVAGVHAGVQVGVGVGVGVVDASVVKVLSTP
jgi:hypothetical protein